MAVLSALYVLLAVGVALARRGDLARTTHDGFVRPFDELEEPEQVAPSR